MSNGFIQQYRGIPRELYRVQYPTSSTLWTANGLQARSWWPFSSYSDPQFLRAMKNHLWWYSTPSPFISLFSDRQRAENWAVKRARSSGEECHVIKINTALIGTQPFHVPTFCSNLPDRIRAQMMKNPSFHTHEYLCLYQIPSMAVTEIRSTAAIEQGK
jgi:hypothetical protein